jgi:hypothetical protein
VPAPAVIPALVVYFKVVAVKTLVVYLRTTRGFDGLVNWQSISYYGGVSRNWTVYGVKHSGLVY